MCFGGDLCFFFGGEVVFAIVFAVVAAVFVVEVVFADESVRNAGRRISDSSRSSDDLSESTRCSSGEGSLAGSERREDIGNSLLLRFLSPFPGLPGLEPPRLSKKKAGSTRFLLVPACTVEAMEAVAPLGIPLDAAKYKLLAVSELATDSVED